MKMLTVNSALIAPSTDKPMTPAMVTALWVIADEIDRRRLPAADRDPVWLEIPSVTLRGEDGRSDNVWLRECLERMTGLKISGDYRGDPWGAVIVAEWHIEQGGAVTRLLIPPAAINALRAPKNFAKVEARAAFELRGHARRLYAAMADKKRMTNHPYWTFTLSELRRIFDCENKYPKWAKFALHVLDPAIEQINDFGTVTVKATPEKLGRTVSAVRLDWQWKTIDEVRETDEENERHSEARRKEKPLQPDAPPLAEIAPEDVVTDEQRAETERILASFRGAPLPYNKTETD